MDFIKRLFFSSFRRVQSGRFGGFPPRRRPPHLTQRPAVNLSVKIIRRLELKSISSILQPFFFCCSRTDIEKQIIVTASTSARNFFVRKFVPEPPPWYQRSLIVSVPPQITPTSKLFVKFLKTQTLQTNECQGRRKPDLPLAYQQPSQKMKRNTEKDIY
jgi:hypothetical protein